jgi:5-methylcytosine-specific restriction endonuclease McrA
MVVRLCLGDPRTGERCNVRVVDGSYCPEHLPAARSPTTRVGARSRWRKVKRRALRRAGGHCLRCWRPSSDLHVHHVKPVSEGGSNQQRNAMVVCPDCHRALHRLLGRPPEA